MPWPAPPLSVFCAGSVFLIFGCVKQNQLLLHDDKAECLHAVQGGQFCVAPRPPARTPYAAADLAQGKRPRNSMWKAISVNWHFFA